MQAWYATSLIMAGQLPLPYLSLHTADSEISKPSGLNFSCLQANVDFAGILERTGFLPPSLPLQPKDDTLISSGGSSVAMVSPSGKRSAYTIVQVTPNAPPASTGTYAHWLALPICIARWQRGLGLL